MEDSSLCADIVEEPQSISGENEWLPYNDKRRITGYMQAPFENTGIKATRIAAALEASIAGYKCSIWVWNDEYFPPDMLELFHQVQHTTHGILEELSNESVLREVLSASGDHRLVIVTFGVILQVLNEANKLNVDELKDNRRWQMHVLVEVCAYFCGIATGDITHFDDNIYHPRFMRSPAFIQPTGSGKSMAGIITCLCSMIRTSGDDVTLLHPRNGKAIWCVTSHALVTEICNQFKNILQQPSFRILAPSTIGNDIVRAYLTSGYGATSPDVCERMFCVMTYEYCRSQLFSNAVFDTGDEAAKRQPLMVSLRCVIVDEAHYIASGGDRALVVDNILAAAYTLHVPVLMLTATPTPQFIQFIERTYPSASVPSIEAQQQRAHDIIHAAFSIPSDEYAHSQFDSKEPVNKFDKLVAFRCVTETFYNPELQGQRAIVFIQYIKSVQLMAAYMSGLRVALQNNGDWPTVSTALNNYALNYAADESQFEGCYKLDRVSPRELVDAFNAGLRDIVVNIGDGSGMQYTNACSKKQNFITYICIECGIIPYFSGIGLNERSATAIRSMLIGEDTADYNIVVATSAILEGVTIAGADNLYITAQGYQMISDTQYIQLTGRVGRQKAGYVETWVPVQRDADGTTLPVKKRDLARKQDSACDVDTTVETDDLIDRVLFCSEIVFRNENNSNPDEREKFSDTLAGQLLAMDISTWCTHSTICRRIGRNSTSNNYYRGSIKPRISMFYTPASLPADIAEDEAIIGSDIAIERYDAYLAQFSATRYQHFFNIFSRQAMLSPAPPHTTLDALTFIDLLGSTEVPMHAYSAKRPLLPSIAFIPIFMKYSYAFNPDRANTTRLTVEHIAQLNTEYEVEKVSSISESVSALAEIVSRLMPGETLTCDRMNKIELISTAFAVSLFISPAVWHQVTGTNFADALSYVVTYLSTIYEQFKVAEDGQYSARLISTVDVLLTHALEIIAALRKEITDTFNATRKAVHRQQDNYSRVRLEAQVSYMTGSGIHTVQHVLGIDYIQYALESMNRKITDLETHGDSLKMLMLDFVHRLPMPSSAF